MGAVELFAALSPERRIRVLEKAQSELKQAAIEELAQARARVAALEAALAPNGHEPRALAPAAEPTSDFGASSEEPKPEPPGVDVAEGEATTAGSAAGVDRVEAAVDRAVAATDAIRPDPETEEAPAPPSGPDSEPPGGAGALTRSPSRGDRLPDADLRRRVIAELEKGEASATGLAAGIPGAGVERIFAVLGELERAGTARWRPFKRGRRYALVGGPGVQHERGVERRQDAPDSPDLETAIASTAGVEPPPPRPNGRPLFGREPGSIEYEILRELGNGPARIPALAATIDRKPAEVAHHVELLKRANLVAKDRTGQIERLDVAP